jgi:hypothetical protein
MVDQVAPARQPMVRDGLGMKGKMAIAASSGRCSAGTKKITCSFVHRKLQEM